MKSSEHAGPDPGPAAEQLLFFECLELGPIDRERRLKDAAPSLAARVRRLLALDEAAELGRAALPPAAVPRPASIGGWRVLETLGEGGMGVVYLCAQKTPLQRLAAVKLIRPGCAAADALARFEAERHALSLMQHPGVARILDAGEIEPGQPWFAMEYVRGESIIEYCARRELDLAQRLRLFLEVCAAVQHAHHKGVLHRDLKPSNLLVAEHEGRAHPVVIDFGVAKLVGGAAVAGPHTMAGLMVGTPDYMSPEQAGVGAPDVDARSDVWSLGAVLYELLAGSPPHRFAAAALSIAEVQRVLASEDPERPSERARSLAPQEAARFGCADGPALARRLRGELDWIVHKALARDRNRRYRAPASLASDLQRHLQGEAVKAHPPSLRYQFAKLLRRHAVLSLGVAAGALALVGITALSLQHAAALREERDRTQAASLRAQEVTRFLTSMFESADPRRGPGGELSARELLDAAVDRIESAPVADAELQAALFAAAARLYLGLGDAGRAEQLARGSVDLRERRQDSLESGESAAILGEVLALRGSLEEAERWQRRAVGLYERRAGDPGQQASIRLALADNLLRQGRHAEALPEQQSALRLLEAAGQLGTGRHASALVIGARIQRATGALEAAHRDLVQALRLLRADPASSRERIASAQSSLGLMLLDLGRSAEAVEIFRTQASELATSYGDRHPDTLVALNNLGLALIQDGRGDEAEPILADAASAMRAAHGSAHARSVALAINHAVALVAVGRAAQAEEQLRANRPLLAAIHGEGHFSLAMLDHHLAGSLLAQGRLQEAEVAAESARGALSAGLGESNHRWLLASLRLVEVYLAQGREQAARELARAIWPHAREVWPTNHPDLQRLAAIGDPRAGGVR